MAFTKILPAGISTTGTVTLERVETTNSIVSLGSTNQLYINTDTPTVRPTLDLNFERDQRLDSKITFSRDSTATYLGSDGLIKTAQPNIPRFEFDTDGNCLGLLIEESRTNLVTYSENFNVSFWDKLYGTTIVPNDTISPDGSQTATRVYQSGTTNNGFLVKYTGGGLSVTTGQTYTLSFFTKKVEVGGLDRVQLSFDVSGQGSYPIGGNIWFNFSDPNSFLSNSGAFYEELSNGWYRIGLTRTATLDGTIEYGLTIDDSNSVGVYVWGIQLELGSFATSYIPTSGSTVTRSADIAQITGTNFTDFYNQSESTIYFESSISPLTNSKYFTFYGYDSGGTELIESASESVPGANIFTYSDSTVHSNISVTNASFTTLKYAAGIEQNNVNLAVNGTLGTTNTSAIQPDALSKLIIGNYSSGNYYINTTIKRLTYYPERLSNAQLQNLTS